MHMVANRPRYTDRTRRTLCLKPSRNEHTVPMQVGAVGYCVANVDAHAELDGMV